MQECTHLYARDEEEEEEEEPASNDRDLGGEGRVRPRKSNGREDRGSIHTSATRVSSRCFFASPLLERTFLETARSGLIGREISPQTNREVAMRKFPS